MDAMINEIDRIAETTTWAGTNLMKDSSSDFKFSSWYCNWNQKPDLSRNWWHDRV
jgi:flagellin-like hook-associated protein FlgL